MKSHARVRWRAKRRANWSEWKKHEKYKKKKYSKKAWIINSCWKWICHRFKWIWKYSHRILFVSASDGTIGSYSFFLVWYSNSWTTFQNLSNHWNFLTFTGEIHQRKTWRLKKKHAVNAFFDKNGSHFFGIFLLKWNSRLE